MNANVRITDIARVDCFQQKGHHGVMIDGLDDDFNNAIPDLYGYHMAVDVIDDVEVVNENARVDESGAVFVDYEVYAEDDCEIPSLTIKCTGKLYLHEFPDGSVDEYGWYTYIVDCYIVE